ncbi:hypothetical protein PHLCEN_2v11068 [Hermanssonia centrifuga]|uniref:Uncharacterized protein n=1 Tax=Hermanssonia centrifuga TaxID=98765 RepID=A0A2R6NL26_9APHY|nr:hypothetical protein PHLCEN_2v11068 [Hermanssonia centrifuga]
MAGRLLLPTPAYRLGRRGFAGKAEGAAAGFAQGSPSKGRGYALLQGSSLPPGKTDSGG